MSKITEFSFQVSFNLMVSVHECDGRQLGATGEDLAANQRLLQAVLHDPYILRLVVRQHVSEELNELFGRDMASTLPIFVDSKEVNYRVTELIKSQFSESDQNILIDGFNDDDLSDMAETFYSAFPTTLTHLQVHPVIDTTPTEISYKQEHAHYEKQG